MSLPANAAYMYKAFTHPDYRGRRLYGVGMALALKALAERGITKLVTTVHTNNFASLSSCRRLGYQRIGRFWTLGRGHRRWAIKPRTVQRLGICFNPSKD
jgi:RimJ/RimL family protein N-acetyltransferase